MTYILTNAIRSLPPHTSNARAYHLESTGSNIHPALLHSLLNIILGIMLGISRSRRYRISVSIVVLQIGKKLSLAKADEPRHLREAYPRMEHCHSKSSDRTHYTVQRNELGFILYEWIAPSAHHLHNPVHVSSEDREEGNDYRNREDLEAY